MSGLKFPNPPDLILGSAMWGWNTPPETVFQLLDKWYERGFRQVDTATNYPIDKDPAHFRLAEKILLEWIGANGVRDLKVMMKIGSVNNLFTPENLLTKSFLLMMIDEYRHLFNDNLHTLIVHWDNRDNEQEIRETMDVLKNAEASGFNVGLSGIKFPEIYGHLNNDYQLDFSIQIKHNVIYSDYPRYAAFHGRQRFITYGINAGGLKLSQEKYSGKSTLKTRGGNIEKEPAVLKKIKEIVAGFNDGRDGNNIDAFFQIGLIHAFYHPEVKSILVGTSDLDQLVKNISFWEKLKSNDYSFIYNKTRRMGMVEDG